MADIDWRMSRGARRTLLLAWAAAGFVLLFLVYVWVVEDISIGQLTRDPADSTDGPTYLGAVSSLGFALWAAAAASCLVGASILRHLDARRSTVAYLTSAGLLSALLAADDMWLLHDRVFPGRLGIPELVVYASYAAFVFGHLWWFREEIMKTDFHLLFLAGLLLAASMVADTITNNTAGSNTKYIVEDGPKLVGMFTWLAYHASATSQIVSRAAGARSDSDSSLGASMV